MHIYVMIISMVLAGYASTMNMWIDNIDDFRFSLNDFYMVGLMTAWMIFFMGLFTLHMKHCLFSIPFIILFFVCIRKQILVTEIQYLRGMIPHHSMAIMMSKRLSKKPNSIQELLNQIIQTQRKEIILMKNYLN